MAINCYYIKHLLKIKAGTLCYIHADETDQNKNRIKEFC